MGLAGGICRTWTSRTGRSKSHYSPHRPHLYWAHDFRHIYSALWDNEAPQIGLLADREREASIVRYALSLPGMTEQVRAFRKQQQEHYREAQAAGYSDIHGAMAHVNERQLIMRLRFQAQNLKPGFVIKIEFSPADYGL